MVNENDWDAARGDGAECRPTFHLSTAGSNQRNSNTDRLAWRASAALSEAGKDPETLLLEEFPRIPQRSFPGYTLLAYRSAGFSNSPRQPQAKRCLSRGTEACAPRWLSDPGQSQWMSATTGTMTPIARRSPVPVCP